MPISSSNQIKQTVKAFGVVPAAYGTLVDYTGKSYENLIVINGCDNAITIRFPHTLDTVSIPATTTREYKGFWHGNGVLQYQYDAAVSSGNFDVVSY